MTSEATGEVEVDDGVLVLKRIHVGYHLRLDPDADREKVERAFDHHMPRCPVCRSIALRWRSPRRSRCSTRETAEGPVAGALELVACTRELHEPRVPPLAEDPLELSVEVSDCV